VALVLFAQDMHGVLFESPQPFNPANAEKRAALEHFQPHGVLVSDPMARPERRRFNEEVLDSARSIRRLGEAIVAKVGQEADGMLAAARRSGALTWDGFAEGWWRMVRRVVLGDGARDEELVTDLLADLRADANWAFLKPKRKRRRERFLGALEDHLARAEPASLASLVSSAPAEPGTYPTEPVPQWLFAFDAAGMASFRALVLLDAHP